MAFRAELASARLDTTTARRWGTAVLELWAGADAALRPTLDQMTKIGRR